MPPRVELAVVDKVKMNKTSSMPEKLEKAAMRLAERIKNTEPLHRYAIAREQFNQEKTAHQILQELSALQAELRQKQFNNQISVQDIEKLRSTQKKAQENTCIQLYAHSQQEAVEKLREINAEISSLLGINFADFAKNTSC